MKKIAIIQRRMPHYRVAFFESLKKSLNNKGIELILAYGSATELELTKNDGADIDWAIKLPTRYFLGGNLCWQPFRKYIGDTDLVILTPENKLINNLYTQYFDFRSKVALWGHGANLQGNPNSIKERFKRVVAKQSDWWFAYTALSSPLIVNCGFPENRITVLNNSVDTSEMIEHRTRVTKSTQQSLLQKYGLLGSNVAVYLGSLYEEKRIDFLLESALAIKRKVPDFELLIIGSGPDQHKVVAFERQYPWVKYLGVLKGEAKVQAYSLAKLNLNPGLVGLGILDAFVCQVPLITTDCGLHSPEIAYLEHQINGYMTNNNLNDYVEVVIRLLDDDALLSKLQHGCLESSKKYTVDNMAENFAQGVSFCLSNERLRTKWI